MRRAAGAAGTVILHAAILAALLHVTARAPAPPPKKAPPVGVHLPQSADRLTGEERTGAGLSCGGYHYNGVGILVSPGGRVLDVGDNTPAKLAGLQEGDVLLDPTQLQPDAYPPGTNLDLRVLRVGRALVIHIHIGRICSE